MLTSPYQVMIYVPSQCWKAQLQKPFSEVKDCSPSANLERDIYDRNNGIRSLSVFPSGFG